MANTNRTFLELQEAIEEDMKLNPGLISGTERQAFLNGALDDIGSLGLLEKTNTITTVDGEVPLPDDFVSVVEVRWVNNGLKLSPSDTPYVTPSTTSINPVYYVLQANVIELIPEPSSDNDVKLTYRYRPVKMIEDDDQPDIPNGWDRLLLDYAIGHCHRKNGEVALYREYMQSYEYNKEKLVVELLRRINSRVNQADYENSVNVPTTPYDYL